jgi:hypothetical protein
MVIYTCEKCFKEFNRKCNYLEHLNKKKPCEQNITNSQKFPDIQKNSEIFLNLQKNSEIFEKNLNNNIFCNFCNKTFSTIFNLNKHYKFNCKIKKIKEEEEEKDKENIFKLLLAKDEEIKKINEENK